MKALVQRVTEAWVVVDGAECGRIEKGLMVLLGVARGDSRADAETLARKVVGARVFTGADGHFDLALADVGGGLLVVSQFTLCARTKKGRRPSLEDAAPPAEAEPLYEHFVATARELGVSVATGIFGAAMDVHLLNEGPVTFIYETR